MDCIGYSMCSACFAFNIANKSVPAALIRTGETCLITNQRRGDNLVVILWSKGVLILESITMSE